MSDCCVAPVGLIADPFLAEGEQGDRAGRVVEGDRPVRELQRGIRVPGLLPPLHRHRLGAEFVAKPTDPAQLKRAGSNIRFYSSGKLIAEEVEDRASPAFPGR